MLAAYECGLLSAPQRTEIERHMMECDLCFEDAYEFSPVAAEIRRVRERPEALRSPRHTLHLLLAAVLVAIAAAGIWIFRTANPEEPPVMRGAQEIRLIAPGPGQETTTPLLLQWQDPTKADDYLVSIFSETGKLIHEAHSKTPGYRWAPEAAPAPGLYRWTVEARLSDGTTTASSTASEFRLK